MGEQCEDCKAGEHVHCAEDTTPDSCTCDCRRALRAARWECREATRRGEAALAAAEQRAAQAEAELDVYKHEWALLDADTGSGITDASTPIFQRVRNIVEQRDAALAQVEEWRQKHAEAIAKITYQAGVEAQRDELIAALRTIAAHGSDSVRHPSPADCVVQMRGQAAEALDRAPAQSLARRQAMERLHGACLDLRSRRKQGRINVDSPAWWAEWDDALAALDQLDK